MIKNVYVFKILFCIKFIDVLIRSKDYILLHIRNNYHFYFLKLCKHTLYVTVSFYVLFTSTCVIFYEPYNSPMNNLRYIRQKFFS